MTSFALTTPERARLSALEAAIDDGFQQIQAAWAVVGAALSEIRDHRLYRQCADTFESYVQQRWKLARRTAYEWIEASAVVANVRISAQSAQGADDTAVIEPPRRVAHAVELSRLPAVAQADALRQAREMAGQNGRHEPTVYEVRRVVMSRLNLPEPPEPVTAREREMRMVAAHIVRLWATLDDDHQAQLLQQLQSVNAHE